jgi:hypothetical protein
MMPCAWDRYFNINPALFDRFDPSLSKTVLLAVRYQAQRWSLALVWMLHDLLVNHDLSSVYFQDEVLPTVQRLLRLVLNQEDLFVSPFASIFRPPEQNPNPCSVLFGELDELYHGFGDLEPTPLQLEKTRHIVAALHDSHDWAYNCLVFVALFVSGGILDEFPYQVVDPLYEPMRTCSTILSEIELDPPKRAVTPTDVPYIGFPPAMQEVEFTWDRPGQLDVLARMAFRLLRFFPHSIGFSTYLHIRRNELAIRYALTECDLASLAQQLGDSLPYPMEQDNFIVDNIVCDITTIASCIADPAAIWFIDEALARRPPDLLPQNSAIKAVRYLRHLRQVHRELSEMDRIPEVDVFSRIQGICRGELLQPLSPLFLPRDVHIPTVIESLHAHFFNNYILFLSDCF